MTKGTYTLLLSVAQETTIDVGALGPITFAAGWYAYTGSAFGPGGFARIDRHRELAAGDRDTRHWHIDYLLGHTATTLDAVYRTPHQDHECTIATALPGELIPDFGASDCGCPSHLSYHPERAPLATALADLHTKRPSA